MLLIRNIGAIVGVRHEAGKALRGSEMDALPVLHDAWLAVEGERIHSYGQMSECPVRECETIDACGRWLFPSFCDSHTHLVFAGSREREFVDKINGLSYAEIAAQIGRASCRERV